MEAQLLEREWGDEIMMFILTGDQQSHKDPVGTHTGPHISDRVSTTQHLLTT